MEHINKELTLATRIAPSLKAEDFTQALEIAELNEALNTAEWIVGEYTVNTLNAL